MKRRVDICILKGDKKKSKDGSSWLSLYRNICVEYIKIQDGYKIINISKLY